MEIEGRDEAMSMGGYLWLLESEEWASEVNHHSVCLGCAEAEKGRRNERD